MAILAGPSVPVSGVVSALIRSNAPVAMSPFDPFAPRTDPRLEIMTKIMELMEKLLSVLHTMDPMAAATSDGGGTLSHHAQTLASHHKELVTGTGMRMHTQVIAPSAAHPSARP